MHIPRSVIIGTGVIASVGAAAWLIRRTDDSGAHTSPPDSGTTTTSSSSITSSSTTSSTSSTSVPKTNPTPEPAPEPAPTLKPISPPAPKPAPTPAPLKGTTISYTVKAGDTLWAIAKRYDTTPAAIAAANGISVDGIIRVGQVLKVPVGEHSSAAPTPSPTPAPSPTPTPTPGNGRVALTFDDGPNGQYTEEILSTLERMHVDATFYMVGQQVAKNPALAARIAREGNQVGNHSWDHSDLSKMNEAGVRDQLRRANDAIVSATGVRPATFRPPYGAVNSTVRALAAAEGMATTMWTIDTRDWALPGTGAIVSSAVNGARSGSIILMHDGGGNRAQTVAAVEQIVNGLRAKGLEPVPVSEL